jgi:plastocyanin
MDRWIYPLAFFVSGCIGRSEAAPIPANVQPHAERAAQAAAAGEGRITGRVTWHGAHPAMPAFTIPPAQSQCGASTPFEALHIGSDEGVRYAVITIVGGSHPAVSPGSATIDQHGCTFEPHVVAVPVGSRLTFSNHDTVLHSVHAFRDSNSDFNLATPPGLTMSRTVSAAGMLRAQCDTGHTWMTGWIDVVDTPWYSVSDAHGAFHIDHLPPGTYTLQMWHEGWAPRPSTDGHPVYSAPVVRTASVTIGANGAAVEHDFSLP